MLVTVNLLLLLLLLQGRVLVGGRLGRIEVGRLMLLVLVERLLLRLLLAERVWREDGRIDRAGDALGRHRALGGCWAR